jgi:hypothetical protein
LETEHGTKPVTLAKRPSAPALQAVVFPNHEIHNCNYLDRAGVLRDVEKVQFPPKQLKLGGYKMPRKSRKSFLADFIDPARGVM